MTARDEQIIGGERLYSIYQSFTDKGTLITEHGWRVRRPDGVEVDVYLRSSK